MWPESPASNISETEVRRHSVISSYLRDFPLTERQMMHGLPLKQSDASPFWLKRLLVLGSVLVTAAFVHDTTQGDFWRVWRCRWTGLCGARWWWSNWETYCTHALRWIPVKYFFFYHISLWGVFEMMLAVSFFLWEQITGTRFHEIAFCHTHDASMTLSKTYSNYFFIHQKNLASSICGSWIDATLP